MKKIYCFSFILFCLFIYSCEERAIEPIACPTVDLISPNTASASETVTLSVSELVALKGVDIMETYEIRIDDNPLGEQAISSINIEKGEVAVEIPAKARSGKMSIHFRTEIGFEPHCQALERGANFEYIPEVKNVNIIATSGDCSVLCRPEGIDVDANGKIYVAETNNNFILQLNSNGAIENIIGNKQNPGCVSDEIQGKKSTFSSPSGLVVDRSNNNIFVSGTGSCLVRKINIAPNFPTFTIGGDCGLCGGVDNSNQFKFPLGLAVRTDGSILIADQSDNRIRELVPQSGGANVYQPGTFAGRAILGSCTIEDASLDQATFCALYDLTIDFSTGKEIIYVTESDEPFSSIRAINIEEKTVERLNLIGADGTIGNPVGITNDGKGNLYVVDFLRKQVFRIDVFTKKVYTLDDGELGNLGGPRGIAYDQKNDLLYVSDNLGGKILKVEIR